MKIHSSAIVHKNAQVDGDVEIGPFCSIGENAVIKSGTKIMQGAIIEGWTEIGKNNQIYPYTCIGYPGQDTRHKGEKSFVIIGNNNVIREYVTVHRATGEGEKTIIGNDNFFMADSHIAHNCIVGNNVTLVNGAGLGGHVVVEDKAIISAYIGIHQHLRIGRMSIVGLVSKPSLDIVPYVMATGNPLRIYGLNTRGLIRHNVPENEREALKLLYKIFFRSKLNVTQALKRIEEDVPKCGPVEHFVNFVKNSKRGVHTK